MIERLPRLEASLGAAVALGLAATGAGGPGTLGTIARLVALAILVLAPLLLGLAATPDRTGRHPRVYRAAVALHPPAALLAAASLVPPPGALAAALAAPWLAWCALVAVFGLVRFLPRGPAHAEETLIDAGLLFLPVGGVWFLFSRAGSPLLGFGEPVVSLTAAHFHVAGFAAPVLAGCAGRALLRRNPRSRRMFRPIAAGVIIGMPLVAAGISTRREVELAGVLVFATSLLALAVLLALRVAPALEPRGPRALLFASAAALAFSMGLALLYGIGEFTGAGLLVVPTMVRTHGAANALGFALCGALAWALAPPPPLVRPPGAPWSRLASRGRVGTDFFQRIGAVPAVARPPRGLVDDLAAYGRPDFAPTAIDPAVRAFYEDTAAHGLLVRPRWRRGFRLAARLYKLASARVGQMNLPVSAERREDLIDSEILPIDEALDGRPGVRAWVRRYTRTGAAVYVAAYANHSHGGRTFMNIAFPIPFGNVTSILRIEALGGGVLLTSRADPAGLGDEGVFFSNRLLPIRLPIDETIRVWPRGAASPVPDAPELEGVTVVARHDMWLFGVPFLTLDYHIFARVPEHREGAG